MNARDGGPRSGSGHSGPSGRSFERYGAERIADRVGTRAVARRSGHGLGRLARGEGVVGAL